MSSLTFCNIFSLKRFDMLFVLNYPHRLPVHTVNITVKLPRINLSIVKEKDVKRYMRDPVKAADNLR